MTKADPTTENGGLFFAHYLVLKRMLGMPMECTDYQVYQSKMDKAYVRYGLYLRSKNHPQRTVSQDEITGFMIASSILCYTSYRCTIWNFLASHFGNYPATGKNKFYNPGSYYAWALAADSSWSMILGPWYWVNLVISSNKPEHDTSSKLIYMTELYALKDKSPFATFLWKYYSGRMELMYGKKWIKALCDIYFWQEEMDHPIRQLAKKVGGI